MITRFNQFLNENLEDEIRQRLASKFNKVVDYVLTKYPKKVEEEEPKSPRHKVVQEEPPKEQPSKELKLKPVKVKGLEDKRLVDALTALTALGYDEKVVKNFLMNIDVIYPETKADDIVKFGIKSLSKF